MGNVVLPFNDARHRELSNQVRLRQEGLLSPPWHAH